MILCDREIEAAIAVGDIVIDPPPTEEQYTSSALDLTMGAEFVAIRAASEIEAAEPRGVQRPIVVDAAEIDLSAFLQTYATRLPLEPDGSFVLRPNQFVLGITREYVTLSPQIAARIEGRSTLARLGLVVHMTAPTIHAGFSGKIALEMYNFGPIPLRLRPGQRVCQLVFERLGDLPRRGVRTGWQGQTTLRQDP